MLCYLDWNVFNKIEKLETLHEGEQLIYSKLSNFFNDENIFLPYSNAHLRDLLRGYKKNPNFIEGHLSTIEKLTNNLCICQYWKNINVTWHYRPVRDFFDELKEEKGEEESFEDLLKWDKAEIAEIRKQLLTLTPIPTEFKLIYTEDPIFHIMFPRTKNEMNLLALTSDLHNFSILIKKDYSIYKALKKFIIKAMHKMRKHQKIISSFKTINSEPPKYLGIDSILDEFTKTQKIEKDNLHYHKILDTYFRYDIKGYKTDSQFLNMVDDGLHTYYAAHCDIFLTNDDRCKYKAEKTYERLKIGTKVYNAKDLIGHFG